MEEPIQQKKSLTQEVIHNSIWQNISLIFSRAGNIVFIMIIARFLLPEGFGLYSLAISTAILFMTSFDLGINETLIRYFSHALKTNNKPKARAYFIYIFKLKIVISFTISLLLFLLAYPISAYVYHKPILFWPLVVSSVYILFLSFGNFFSSFFYIFRKVKLLAVKDFILESSKVLIIIPLFFLIPFSFYVVGVFWSLVLSSFIAMLVAIFYTKKISPDIFKAAKVKIDKSRIWKFLFFVTINSITLLLFLKIDIIMLGILIDDMSYIGFYNAAFTLIININPFLSIYTVLFPIFTQIKKQQLKQTFNKIARYTFIISFPACFGLIVLGKYFIKILYGANYSPAAFLLYFLPLFFLYLPISSLFSSVFSAMEKPKLVSKIMLYSIIINIILNYIFIVFLLKISLLLAITGAAIATLISRFVIFVSLLYSSKKHLNISLEKKIIIKPLIFSLIMAASMYFFISHIDVTLISGSLVILMGFLIYLFLMIIFKGLTKEDFQIIKFIIPNWIKSKFI